MTVDIDFEKYYRLNNRTFFKSQGKIANVVGLTIESLGPDAKLGDLCSIYSKDGSRVLAISEVIGFRDGKTLLMPFEN
ncbi:MAG: flagellum-specific ATP synthase FliI, partial [Lachnospiraceae bacterium]|nr:flagellum-specific ATP synthase FliI [Lachnospiraceae bacterium]